MTQPSEILLLWLVQSGTSYQLFGFPWQVLLLPFFALVMIGAIWASSFFPRSRALRLKGEELARRGLPADAEACFRKVLANSPDLATSDRVRLLVLLADALIDRCKYEESRDYLNKALLLGDSTGRANSSMAQSYLLEGIVPQSAIEEVDKAMELHARSGMGNYPAGWGERFHRLVSAGLWAQKGWALAQLKREGDARHALETAAESLEAAKSGNPDSAGSAPLFGPDLRMLLRLGVAETHWRIAMALAALHDPRKAAPHLELAREADPKGKYGLLAAEQLKQAAAAEIF
jgi:tetratricopeptide (TPR) repeat protein